MNSQVHSLVGAYAVDAVSLRERGLFESHLPDCADCTQEARELIATAGLLGIAAASPVPPQLRERVFTEVARTRQIRPRLRARASRHEMFQRVALASAACLVVVSLASAEYAAHARAELSASQVRDGQVAALLTEPDARTVRSTAGAATGTVTLSPRSGRMMFLARGLSGLASGRTYQIWLTGPSSPISAGTFRPTGAAPTPVMLVGSPGARRLMVTEEPAGGSSRPTSVPVLQLDLAPA